MNINPGACAEMKPKFPDADLHKPPPLPATPPTITSSASSVVAAAIFSSRAHFESNQSEISPCPFDARHAQPRKKSLAVTVRQLAQLFGSSLEAEVCCPGHPNDSTLLSHSSRTPLRHYTTLSVSVRGCFLPGTHWEVSSKAAAQGSASNCECISIWKCICSCSRICNCVQRVSLAQNSVRFLCHPPIGE